jgi:tRNA (guanine-N7-)-methyltransferase
MAKNKLNRFREMTTFKRVFQPDINFHSPDHPLKGTWHNTVFENQNPIVIEAGCGRGEYTVALAEKYPNKNFIGIDIKGARIWRGAKTANEQNMLNAAFLRTRMELIGKFFAENEISEIWVTFPDPQPRESKENVRLISPAFINLYKKFLKPGAIIHLKTDNKPLFDYALSIVTDANYKIITATDNLYAQDDVAIDLLIKTTYEKKFLAQGFNICYLSFVV